MSKYTNLCTHIHTTLNNERQARESKKKYHTENIEKEEANVIKLAHPFRLCSLLHKYTLTHTTYVYINTRIHPLLLAHQRHRHALTLRQPLFERFVQRKTEREKESSDRIKEEDDEVLRPYYYYCLNNNKNLMKKKIEIFLYHLMFDSGQ